MQMNDLVIVSVDDHVAEPGDMFDKHLTKEQMQNAPKLMTTPTGTNYWQYEDFRLANIGLNSVVGRPPEEYGMEPKALTDMRAGTYDVHARIEDMNVNGIAASLNFATFPGFEGSLFLKAKDKKNALTMLKAHNDWSITEWCAAYPGRFIPNAMLPMWDVGLMVEEARRVHDLGCTAITFIDNPTFHGLPSIHNEQWEPLWEVCHELELVINLHIGVGNPAPHASMETPIDAWIATMPMSIAVGAADWLQLSALQRYPNLKIALSEGGIGWIPYFLERNDFTHAHHHRWTHSDFGGRRPSDIFREHFLTCFIDDRAGLSSLDLIGEDLVAYECDYPHSDSVWPNSPELLWKSIEGLGLSREQIDKISHRNAMKFFRFDLFSYIPREELTVGALRDQARHVDLSYKTSGGGAKPLADGEARRRVTSGDIAKMFSAHAEAA